MKLNRTEVKQIDSLYRISRKALLFAAFLLTLCACNKDKEDGIEEDNGTLAVTAFSLKYDSDNIGIDSVYFAIDLNRGVIYNADSLPPGSKIDKLIPVIKYPSSVERAVINMTGGTTLSGEVDYKENPTDTIDFTGKVTLTLGRGDLEKIYDIKVNVHKEMGDSLKWDEAVVAQLPSRLPNPLRQKTVQLSDTTAVMIIAESDGSFTRAFSDNMYDNIWQKTEISFPFTPNIETFSAAGDATYILSDQGVLFTSLDESEWTDTGKTWRNMLGGYINSVIGLREEEGAIYFDQYPTPESGNILNPVRIPDNFPITGFSNMVTLSNKWTLTPMAFLVGGRAADGSVSGITWGFDGAEWINLSNYDLPAIEGASLIPYYSYRATSDGVGLIEYKVWMLLGGKTTSNDINRTVYITYDNGVHWQPGSGMLQLPEAIPAMWGCDNIVMSSSRSADLSDNWKVRFRGTRMDYNLDGTIISWKCPYIYLIGGTGTDGTLCNTIWRGVLTRLTFTPLI